MHHHGAPRTVNCTKLVRRYRRGTRFTLFVTQCADRIETCRSGHLGGYGGDVLCTEPMQPGHPFQDIDNIIITPHVGSRTFESVERQAMRATTNLIEYLTGGSDYIQANETEAS